MFFFFFNLKNTWFDRILRNGIVTLLTDDIVVMTDRKKYNKGKKIKKKGSTSMGLRSPNKLMRSMQAIPSVLIST